MGIKRKLNRFYKSLTAEGKLENEVNDMAKYLDRVYKNKTMTFDMRKILDANRLACENAEKELMDRRKEKLDELMSVIRERVMGEYASKLFINRYEYLKKEFDIVKQWESQ